MKTVDVLKVLQGAFEKSGQWAIIGAVARNAWAPPRATTDLDLTVVADRTAMAVVRGALESLGYTQVREQRAEPADPLPDILVFRNDNVDLRQVDVLVGKTRFEEDVLRRAEAVAIGELQVPVATPEALVVYKLLADRPRDREDIRAVLRTQARAARSFDWTYVESWSDFWKIRDRLKQLRDEIS